MKTIKNLLSLIIIAGVLVSNLGRQTLKSTTHQTVTVDYPESVPDAVAQGVAEITVEADLANERKVRLELEDDKHSYRLISTVVGNTLTPETLATFEFFARVMTDRISPGKPIVFEVTSESGNEILGLIKPVAPMGKVLNHRGDFLYYSENISQAQAKTIAEGLARVGYFKGVLTMARVIRTEDAYLLHLALAGDQEKFESQAFQDAMLIDSKLYQNELFGGATTKIVCSELNMQPRGELAWTATGLDPDQRRTQVDNIVVIHDEVIAIETATSIATRFPARNVAQHDVQMTLTGDGREFECCIDADAQHVEEFAPVAAFWGREVFSEMSDGESLKLMLVDAEGTILLTRDTTSRHGAYLTFNENRLLYPADTPESVLENVQQGLRTVGLWQDATASISRLSRDAEGYRLQVAVAPGSDTASLQPEVRLIGESIGKVAFPDAEFVFEVTDFDFVPFANCTWRTNERVSSMQPSAVR